jgi:hypothetical protein
LLAVSFVVGLACGAGLMFFLSRYRYKFPSRNKGVNIKDEKTLLMMLLEYKDDKEVQKIIDILEGNLYHGKKQPIDKKLLREIIKKYNLS